MTTQSISSLRHPPVTRLGKWAVGLGAVFVVLFLINSLVFMPLFSQSTTQTEWQRTLLAVYGIFMFLCGLAAGIAGLIAVFRHHERSWLVWLTILPGTFVIVFLLGEFLVPH